MFVLFNGENKVQVLFTITGIMTIPRFTAITIILVRYVSIRLGTILTGLNQEEPIQHTPRPSGITASYQEAKKCCPPRGTAPGLGGGKLVEIDFRATNSLDTARFSWDLYPYYSLAHTLALTRQNS